MKLVVLGITALLIYGCKVKKAEPSISIDGVWKWVSTSRDSTFYEDTASSANNQILNLIDYKNIDWKRNDTTFYKGVYIYNVKPSQTLGVNKPMMKLYGVSYEFMLNNDGNTLWVQEDRVDGFTYRFYKE